MLRRCCEEFARAGDGLPAIEPGMPAPAGTGLDRRAFVARAAGALLGVYGASRLPLRALEEGIAAAAGRPDRVLVSVFLAGGADVLSVLAPVGDPLYRRLRPKLALRDAELPFSGDDRLHWHPAAAPLARLHDAGKLAVLPAVGYAHPNQSHFTSRHFYEVGALDTRLRTGWLGRYLDRVGTPDNPLQGLCLDGELSPSLAPAKVPVAAIEGPTGYEFWASGVWGEVETRMLASIGPAAAVRGTDPGLAEAARVAARAGRLRAQLAPLRKRGVHSPVEYPKDRFADGLAGVAAMLGAGLPLRCVSLTAAGEYDTHADQAAALDAGLRTTAASLAAFQADLESRGLADRVLTLVWSEFGRRAEENGSAGTDHGAGGLALVLGSRARGGTVGEFPGLRRLDADGNLRPTSDFRALYASLLEQWLRADAEAIIPGARSLPRYRLVR